jgi:hypothetical protein
MGGRSKLPSKNFRLHLKQGEVANSGKRFTVLCAGRRFGKTKLIQAKVLEKALDIPENRDLSDSIVLVGFPTLKVGRRLVFKPLIRLLKDHPLVERIDKTECTIELKGNRPTIVFAALAEHHAEKVRGSKIWFAVLDEFQDVQISVFNEIISPAMADCPGSEAIFTGTPKGKVNSLFEVSEYATKFPEEWIFYHFFTSDNPYVSRSEIAKAKARLSPRLFAREFEASFLDFEGKIFTELSDSAIATAPTEFKQTWIGVDWGDRNPCAVAIGLDYDNCYWLLEVWENKTEGIVPLEDFVEHIGDLAKRWKAYRCYCDPANPGHILSLRRAGKRRGIDGLTKAVRGANAIHAGLSVLNNLIYCDRFKFSDKLARSVFDRWMSYHWDTDKASRPVEGVVKDGQDDHVIDPSRYVIFTLEGKYDLALNAEKLDATDVDH